MNKNVLVKHYPRLTPEERFALILKASARGDDAERNRPFGRGTSHYPVGRGLRPVRGGVQGDRRIRVPGTARPSRRVPGGPAPHRRCAGGPREYRRDRRLGGLAGCGSAAAKAEGAPPVPSWPDARARILVAGRRARSNWQRHIDLFLAHGYLLKAKRAGWAQWCERRHLPPYLLWEAFPGHARLTLALEMTEQDPAGGGGAAFAPDGMRRWLDAVGPTDREPSLRAFFSPVELADELEQVYQNRVRFHGG